MLLVKPACLSLLSRPLEYRGRYGLSLTALLYLPIAQPPEGNLWSEQSLWTFFNEALPGQVLDEGVAKLVSEFLVSGAVYPAEPGAPGHAAHVQLAQTGKTVLAFGRRYWDGKQPRAVAAMEPVPLDWRHAYGGQDVPANPQGMGRQTVDGVRWLPQLELPHARMTHPDQAVEPAGLGPLDMLHPQRAALRGTYDADYLQQHAPGFPPDLDWRHFNRAPRDQWLETPLRGDEPYSLRGLHPTRPLLEGRLPGLRARVFAHFGTADGAGKLKEVPMRLTTVWFFPDAERMVLSFQGLAEVGEHDGADVTQLMAGVERLNEPRSDGHYTQVLAKRLDPRDGALEALNDADLLPDGLSNSDPQFERAAQAFQRDNLQAQAQHRRAEVEIGLARERLLAEGKDPDAMGVKLAPRDKPPSLAELPSYLQRQRDDMAQQQWALLDEMAAQLEKAMQFAQAQQIDLKQLAHRGPPRYRSEQHLAELKAQFGAGQVFNEAELLPKLRQKEALDRLGYLQSAHMQPPVPAMPADQAQERRREVAWLVERGFKSLPGIDLTGADLSAMDLRGIDFSGAWLEGINLRGANVSGCNFSAAVLAHAQLGQCLAIGANFSGANLGRAELAGAVFDGAVFDTAIFTRTAMAQTQMRKARLSGCNLQETTWGAADWRGAQLAGMGFHQLDLRGVVLAEADLASALFLECDLREVDLRGANLAAASFVTCRLEGAQLNGAQLPGAVFAKQTVLDGADFSRANLARANLGETSAQGALFVGAQLARANLTLSKLERADLRLVQAQGALLRKARLQGARLAGANLMEAVLAYADLRDVDVRGANLYTADLSRVVLNSATLFEGALTQRARTWPRLNPEQQARANSQNGAPP